MFSNISMCAQLCIHVGVTVFSTDRFFFYIQSYTLATCSHALLVFYKMARFLHIVRKLLKNYYNHLELDQFSTTLLSILSLVLYPRFVPTLRTVMYPFIWCVTSFSSVPTDLRPLLAQSGKQQREERWVDVLAPLDLPHLLLLRLRNHQHRSLITPMRKLVNYEVTCLGENPFLTVFYYWEQLANLFRILVQA